MIAGMTGIVEVIKIVDQGRKNPTRMKMIQFEILFPSC
jgi:hypothetical protein